MKKMTCNIDFKNDLVFYIYNINNMKIYLKITVNVAILGLKITCF